jgi:hypothetical protein
MVPWISETAELINNIFMTRTDTTPKEQQSLKRKREIAYIGKAAPWSGSNHHMGIRLFPSSNNSENNFSGTPPRPGTEILINQATLCLRLLNYACFSPPTSILPLLKPKAQVSTPKID